jgi:hypothetical protein
MFEAHIEANMPDDEIAQFLAEDAGWLEAQWPEAIRQAENDGKQVTGNPQYVSHSRKGPSNDGYFYDFVFNVPVA